MALAATNEGLRRRAVERVLSVREDPEDRYHLRKTFYRRYGFVTPGPAGYGNSELAFLRWEIDRGILNPLDHPRRPGSRWWRAVNEKLLLDAELAALLHEAGADPAGEGRETRLWLDYLASPSPVSWYRAHNGSVVAGYRAFVAEALLETEAERRFLGRVLDRLLFAQALITPGALADEAGSAGRLASPEGPFVDFAVRVRELYPRSYPLAPDDEALLEQRGAGGVAELVDDGVIGPRLPQVRAAVAAALGAPEVTELTGGALPAYARGEHRPPERALSRRGPDDGSKAKRSAELSPQPHAARRAGATPMALSIR